MCITIIIWIRAGELLGVTGRLAELTGTAGCRGVSIDSGIGLSVSCCTTG